MSNLKNRRIFYVNSASWTEPALVALPIAIASVILEYHFLYLHLYLLAASLICFLLSCRKYAVLNDRSLTILLRTNEPKIIIDYDQIESIESESKEINGVLRLGGKLGGVPNCVKEIKYLSINLRTPLGKQHNPHAISKHEVDIEDKKIEIAENALSVFLYKPPKGGFRPFLDAISKSVKVLNADMFDYENKYPNLGEILIYFVTSAGIICMLCVSYKMFNQ